MEKHKIVRVHWLDTTSYGDRKPLSVAKEAKLTPCQTVGLLIYKDSVRVVILHQVFNIPELEEPVVSEFTAIPRGCITRIEALNEG